jgi:transposase InsO family protein
MVTFILPQIKKTMPQQYHTNAKTNIHVRSHIQVDSSKSNLELALRYSVSANTISKWKNRTSVNDKSSRPIQIEYALTDIEQALIISIRRSSWLPLDEVFEVLLAQNATISRSSVHRCFVRNDINKVPILEKDKAKKFKAYQPGYLHVDVTYLPKFNGKPAYLFVAIDRATRVMFFWVYEDKTAQSTSDFFDKSLAFFPFEITHILTDNGLEFSNRLIRSKTGNLCTKPSLLDEKCKENDIDHRLTPPSSPQTNGMVERVNGTIKNNTILRTKYKTRDEMEQGLVAFLAYYNLYRRHGSLRKELNVKTPFEAVEKWYELTPEIFKMTPKEFNAKILLLTKKETNSQQQPCET